MQFTQSAAGSRLYFAADDTGTRRTLLYLLPPGGSLAPAEIGFADSWTTFGGAYLFLEQPLATGGETRFAASAAAFLADRRLQGARFVWFDLPDGSGLLTGTSVAVAQTATSAVTGFPVPFRFQNVSLELAAGAAVTADTAACTFTFQQQAGPAGASLRFAAGWGGVAVGNVVSNLLLPLAGPLAGCLQCTLAAPQAQLDDLDVGLRTFYALPPDPAAPGDAATDFFLTSQRCPIFAADLTLHANLDPLAPLDPARTFFAFNGSDAGQSNAPAATAVSTHYRSTLADVVSFAPQTGAALVFVPNQQSANCRAGAAFSPRDPLYLVPRGDFALKTQRAGSVNAMCGLSGVEYLVLSGTAGATNLISFFPGHDAFAAGFFPDEAAGYTPLKPATGPTTAFASVTTVGGTVDYFAQPDESVLYNYGAPLTAITMLAPVPVLAAAIPSPPSDALAFPLRPYAGVTTPDLEAFQQMESQIISPWRRLKLVSAPPKPAPTPVPPPAPQSKYCTTPQGLLATYTPGSSTWDEIVLAQMNTTPAQRLEFTGVTGDLLTAFQSNKLFLVISNPKSIQPYLSADNARITLGADPTQPWNFDLRPQDQTDPGRPANLWTSYGTILIVKFYDLCIQDLATQPGSWSAATTFNASPAATARAITAIIDAVDPADGDFATFLDAVTNPDWNGILALNVDAPLANLPLQLAGLAAGIDPAKFFAHHIGINASQVTIPPPAAPGGSASDFSISHSSIFGLINYNAPAPLAPQQGDYQFQVERLKVLFIDSDVATFASIIDLQINTLFGEPATLLGADDTNDNNTVRMYGRLQKQVVNGVPHEYYSYSTQSGAAATFALPQSAVLNAVQIARGQFLTITDKSSTSRTDSQFVLWGLLDFKALGQFDVFSFGREASAATPAGLSYGNLILEMTFDPRATPIVAQFAFDASHLSFDLAGSTPRSGSFFRHFPLTIAGFTQAKEGVAPADLGYMGVQTPLAQSTLEYPWFSLNFNVNLGSPGALAAEAGFVASLTAAWSPNTGRDPSNYTVFIGLKLPGSSGAKREISLQGIFNITFKTLEIVVPAAANTFILVLYNIGFKFLSFTFPPTGQVNFVLFGNPDAPGGNTSLGWYAAYAKPGSGGGSDGGEKSALRLAAAPRPRELAAANRD